MNQSFDYYKDNFDIFDSSILTPIYDSSYRIIKLPALSSKRYNSTERSSEYQKKYLQAIRLSKVNLKFPIRKKLLPEEFDHKLSPINIKQFKNFGEKQHFKFPEYEVKYKRSCIKTLDSIFSDPGSPTALKKIKRS